MSRLLLRRTCLATAATMLTSLGCNGSGQTGSPFDETPSYQGSNQFAPVSDGDGDGNSGEEDPGSRPDWNNQDGEMSGFSDGYLVVAAVDQLRVYDVASSAPRQVGEIALRGRVRQIEVTDGRAWVLLAETAFIEAKSIPKNSQKQSTERLLAFDLSDPESPKRLAELELSGEAWAFERRGNNFFTVEELAPTPEHSCTQHFYGEGRGIAAMKFRHIRFENGQFEELNFQEVATRQAYSFYSEDTFFVADWKAPAPQSELSIFQFSDDGLGAVSQVTLPATPRSIVRSGNIALALLQNGEFQVLSLADETWKARGSIAMTASASDLMYIEGTGFVATSREGGGAILLDVTDPDAPKVSSTLAPDTGELIATETGVLSLGTDEEGHLNVGLWDLSDPEQPEMVDSLVTDLNYRADFLYQSATFTPGALHSWTYDAQLKRLIVPELSHKPRLAVLEITDNKLSLLGFKSAEELVLRPVVREDAVYSVRGTALRSSTLVGAEPWNELLYAEPKPIDTLVVDRSSYELWFDAEANEFYVLGQNEKLSLDHNAQKLAESAGRLVVVGMQADDECEQWQAMGGEFEEEGEACAERSLKRGISIVDVSDGLALVESIHLAPNVDGVAYEKERQRWAGYAVLPDGRLIFPTEHIQTCKSQAACDELGVKAYRSDASNGCSSGEDCETGSMVGYSGSRRSLRLHTLENTETDSPSLKLQSEVFGEFDLGPGDGSPELQDNFMFSGGGMGLARYEWVYNDQGNSVSDANGHSVGRNFFTRFSLSSDGAIELIDDINTPGVPVLWSGDQLLSISPNYISEEEVRAHLIHSQLKNGGAFIEESRSIELSFRGSVHSNGYAYPLFGAPQLCSETEETQLLPLTIAEGKMAVETPQILPGSWHYWSVFPVLVNAGLKIYGGPVPGAAALFSLEEPAAPELQSYSTQ